MSENASIEVGKKLHDARVAKGMTLDDLQQATKIQKRYLIAIEDEKFDELPGDFYVRAFVKQYADTVGLDGNDLLLEFNDQLPETKTGEYSKHIEQAVETRTGQHKAVDQIDRIRQYLPTVIVVVVIIVVLGAIWLTAIHSDHRSSQSNIDSSSVSVSGESSKKKSSDTSKKNSSSSSSTTSAKIKLSSVTRTSSAATFKVENAKSQKYTLAIAPSERAWVAVTGDGTSLFSQTMTANSKQSVKIGKSVARVVLTLGNAGSTTIKLNGKTVDVTDNNKYPNVRTVTIVLSGSTATTSDSSSAASSTSISASSTSN
ncbi:helix-turn-helix domain-containing protein [Paucilactobacillus kaifaensis]|uniref:helix-turn-helix domain-containing protein n=1 Tax=Paucilactobacillus kaifaensis TaxID=2559921 RepID=UPI0010F681EF|nr:helix-turn-helix domain-containing protein [Paucilactobacillus kaifaensis]